MRRIIHIYLPPALPHASASIVSSRYSGAARKRRSAGAPCRGSLAGFQNCWSIRITIFFLNGWLIWQCLAEVLRRCSLSNLIANWRSLACGSRGTDSRTPCEKPVEADMGREGPWRGCRFDEVRAWVLFLKDRETSMT
jgi:hypothetical protein